MLALSWNPFLLVCVISVLLFVLFGSLTFAIMKFADPATDRDDAGTGGGELATLKQSAGQCLSKSDEQHSGGSSSSSCASAATNMSGGQTRRARIITLAANRTIDANGKQSCSLENSLNQPGH